MNIEASRIISKVVLPSKTVKIKLLGDSITHGVGGTGFSQNGEPIVCEFARNPLGYCWANRFRDFIEGSYDCKVTNNACTGTTIEFIIEHFENLVDRDDDIVICTIGTNNRHQYFDNGEKHTKREHMDAFYNNIRKLYGMFKNIGVDVIFVANIPASAKNEEDGENYWRIFHMNDVRDMYLKASYELGFPLIPMYNRFTEYCVRTGTSIDDLLGDGLHPNDKGYDVMFDIMLDELGLVRCV
jgi:lysophospholipase L1-like esterase